MPIEGDTFEDLRQAIQSAFPSRQDLDELLEYKLSKDLDTISPSADVIGTAVFKVIKKARSEGWLKKLVVAAKKRVPGNELLTKFDIGRLEAVPPQRNLLLSAPGRQYQCALSRNARNHRSAV